MSTYIFEIPIFVYHTSDEHENSLAVNRPITDMVIASLRDNSTWRDYFPESVTDCRLEPLKDRIVARVETISPSQTDEEGKQVLVFLTGWMRYGYFDGGLTVPGRYYKYPYEEVSVHAWDSKLPISLRKTASPEEKNG